MKSFINFIIFFSISNLLFAQNIQYKVYLKQFFSEKGLEEFKNTDYDTRKSFIEQNQNPPPSYYNLIISENFSLLNYIPSIDNQQNDNKNNVSIAPFGFSETIGKTDSKFLLIKHPKIGKNIYSNLHVLDIEWINTNRDSLILGYTVKEAIGIDKETNFKYTIWYTDQLPKNLGLYNLRHKDGFVISLKAILNNPDESMEKIEIEAIPYKISKLKKREIKLISKKMDMIKSLKVYNENEIKEMYDTFNKKQNEMLNGGVEISD